MADYSDLITKYSQKYGVPENLVSQLINVESSGNASAVSPTGPIGLMQVSSAVAKEAGYSKKDMYDPEKNIDAGTRYLAKNLKAFNGVVPHALLGYNQGTGGAQQMLAGKIPMAQEGWAYIHNKKFSPEYLSKDKKFTLAPQPQQSQPQQGQQTAGTMQYAPPPQAQQPQQKPIEKAEPTEADKYNAYQQQMRQLFDQAFTYATQPQSAPQRQVQPLKVNNPFGGFGDFS